MLHKHSKKITVLWLNTPDKMKHIFKESFGLEKYSH